MRALRRTIASLLLTASLLGVAVSSVSADPGDGLPPPTPATYGPTCYGSNYSYHIWNLFHPMTAYGVNSCAVNRAITLRAAYATQLTFASTMTTLVAPYAGASGTVMTYLYNTNTDILRLCAASGRGVELVISNRTGVVIQCTAQ